MSKVVFVWAETNPVVEYACMLKCQGLEFSYSGFCWMDCKRDDKSSGGRIFIFCRMISRIRTRRNRGIPPPLSTGATHVEMFGGTLGRRAIR